MASAFHFLPVQRNGLLIERFKVEETMAKVALHQAAMGNTGQSHNTSMNLKRQEHEEKLRSVVSNYNNMSVQSYMESICSFFDKKQCQLQYSHI
jgi:hypothetical protein